MEEQNISSMHKGSYSRLVIALVVVVAAAGAWFAFSKSGSSSTALVATINGQEFTHADLAFFVAQAKNIFAAQGANVEDKAVQSQIESQAMDALISDTLLLQAAARAGVTVEEADVDTVVARNRDQFTDEATFLEALTNEGFTEESFHDRIRTQLITQKYLEESIDFSTIEATDGEIESLYEQEVGGIENPPVLSVVRDQIIAFIIREKQQELIAAFVSDLRAQGQVEIFN